MTRRRTGPSLIGFPLLGLLLRVLGTTLLVAVLLVGFVVGTQTGLRLAVALAGEVAPEMVSVGSVEGRLLGELTVTDLRLNLPGLALDAGRLHLAWSPGALFRGRLHVADLSAADIDIVTTPTADDKPKEPFKLPEIRLPIAVDIERVLVERLSFRDRDAPPESALRVTRAELAASADGSRVALEKLDLVAAQPDAEVHAAGSVELVGDYPVDLGLDWQLRQPPGLALTGTGRIGGDLATLGIVHKVTGAAALTLDATVRDLLEKPAWDAEITLTSLDLPAIVPDAPPVDLRAELKSAGDLDRATVTGDLVASAPDLADFGSLKAALDLTWAEQRLTLSRVHLDETANDATLDLTGHMDLAGATPQFDLEGTWAGLRWPPAGEPLVSAPSGELSVTGDLDAFTYGLKAAVEGPDIPATALTLSGTGDAESTRIEALLVETLGGRIEARGNLAWAPTPTWDLAVTAADIDPGRQWPGLDGSVALKADSAGGLEEGYSLGANVTAALTAYPPVVLNLAGTGDAEQLAVDTLSIETLGGAIDGVGKVAWVPGLTWDLRLIANDLDPGRQYGGLDGRVGFELTSAGGLDNGFDYRLQGSAALAAYPPAVVDVRGTGSAESAEIAALDVAVLNGQIAGSGNVAWAPALGWNADLTLTGLDPGTVLADWPGRVGGRISSQGRLGAAGPELTATISDVDGELRGYPVRLAANIEMQGETLRLAKLDAGSGTTRLDATGSLVGEALDFRADLGSPDLAALLPGAAGSLDVTANIGGTLAQPRLRLTLTGSDIAMDAQGIEQVSGSADVGLGPDGDFDIDVTGSNLIVGTLRFDDITVDGSGRMPDHRLNLALTGDALSAQLALAGGLAADGAYKGSLGTLQLASETFGTWSLTRPAGIAYADGGVRAGPLCLGNGKGSGACAGFEQPAPGRFEVSLDADRIELAVLNPVLPELLVLKGFVRAEARFRGEGTALTGNARITVPEGQIEMALDEARDQLVFAGTSLTVNAGAAGLTADFDLPLVGLGGVAAQVSLPGFDLASGPAQPLRGTAQVRLDGLARISSLLPDVTNVTGNIDGDVRLAGTVAEPDLRGELRVRGLGLTVPLYGTTVSGADLTVASRGPNDLVIDGAAEVGGGRVTIDGSVDLAGATPQARIRISGNDLKPADSREYFVRLSTDITIGVGPAGAAVTGQVTVPEARIKPRTVPTGAVQPSPDVVMEAPDEDQAALPLSIDVVAKLGDEVSIDAFGLRGLLRGELRVSKAPQGQIIGDGQLQIVDGTYRVTLPTLGVLTAIGKPLTIEQGIVNFAKTPLDNPGLVLNAQREGGDITAGVQVLGTLKNPKLSFFSDTDPNLTQAEITQYLVTGIPPKRDAQADRRAISVGTYVAPKLYMEYESNTGDARDSVKMRYDLSNRIELQTETGDSQGADIFFKFEN
jgi:translocation and assembly module TamB